MTEILTTSLLHLLKPSIKVYLKNFYIKEIKISCCNLDSAVNELLSVLKLKFPEYICVTDAGNLVNAYRKSPELKTAINNSLMSLPDGRPISIFAGIKGIDNIDRVAGPDFMKKVFEKTSGTGIRHFFLGDTESILSKLSAELKKNYDLQIAGFYSPPFGNWNSETDNLILDKIREANADIIWISLGGRKQEVWMNNNYRKLNKGVMIGVGAAYRFYLGEIKRAPKIFQRLGLEWFFRLIQQPGKMFKRYLTTLPFFIIYIIQDLFNKNKHDNPIH